MMRAALQCPCLIQEARRAGARTRTVLVCYDQLTHCREGDPKGRADDLMRLLPSPKGQEYISIAALHIKER